MPSRWECHCLIEPVLYAINVGVSVFNRACSLCHQGGVQGWLSSGKKGISSLPWEETWEKREETPFFPEEMEETRKKLGIKVCYSLLHHCQQL